MAEGRRFKHEIMLLVEQLSEENEHDKAREVYQRVDKVYTSWITQEMSESEYMVLLRDIQDESITSRSNERASALAREKSKRFVEIPTEKGYRKDEAEDAIKRTESEKREERVCAFAREKSEESAKSISVTSCLKIEVIIKKKENVSEDTVKQVKELQKKVAEEKKKSVIVTRKDLEKSQNLGSELITVNNGCKNEKSKNEQLQDEINLLNDRIKGIEEEVKKGKNVIELKNKILQLKNKLLKEKVSTEKEKFKRALAESNERHKNAMDDRKQLEEELEARKMAYETQIGFLKKEIELLKGQHHTTEESGTDSAEIPPKDSEVKDGKVDDKLTDVKEALTCKQKGFEQLEIDFKNKSEQLSMSGTKAFTVALSAGAGIPVVGVKRSEGGSGASLNLGTFCSNKFGMGFCSAYLAADKVIVTSKHGNDVQYIGESHERPDKKDGRNSDKNDQEFGANDDEENDDWAPEDISEEAVKVGMEALSGGFGGLVIDNDKEKPKNERINMFYKIQSGLALDAMIQEGIVSEVERLEVKNKAPIVLCELLFDEKTIKDKQNKKNRALFFISGDETCSLANYVSRMEEVREIKEGIGVA